VPLDGITFELQRRINVREDYVRKALSEPAQLVEGMTTALGDEGDAGLFVLQAPFRPASFPYEDSLHAPAVLTSMRGRRIAIVRLEVSPWSYDATALAVRPLASRHEHWSTRHIEHYFTLAHACADTTMRMIRDEVVRTMGADHDIS
jgi:hypothetical protein